MRIVLPIALVFAVPYTLSEANTFKVGLVLTTIVAAIGLQILVNWAGEFSLAHAAFIGLPAFLVAGISSDHHVSPIYLLPVALATGAALGTLVALPTLRTRGVQVALVTLTAGVAIDRFFFTKEWFVGQYGIAQVEVPSFAGQRLDTARALYPVLAFVAVMSCLGAWMLFRSRLGRSFRWIKTNPDAASAFGMPVRRYRLLAFSISGAYAGLAGGLSAMWVQDLSPGSFPLTASVTYLLFAMLAGPGFIWGVVLSAGLFEIGRLFISGSGWFWLYAGPIGLIISLVRYPAGVNGMLRTFRRRIARRSLGATKQVSSQAGPNELAGPVDLANVTRPTTPG